MVRHPDFDSKLLSAPDPESDARPRPSIKQRTGFGHRHLYQFATITGLCMHVSPVPRKAYVGGSQLFGQS